MNETLKVANVVTFTVYAFYKDKNKSASMVMLSLSECSKRKVAGGLDEALSSDPLFLT